MVFGILFIPTFYKCLRKHCPKTKYMDLSICKKLYKLHKY